MKTLDNLVEGDNIICLKQDSLRRLKCGDTYIFNRYVYSPPCVPSDFLVWIQVKGHDDTAAPKEWFKIP